MKKLAIMLLIFLFINAGCAASVGNEFLIDIGTKNNQIGYKSIDNSYKGPLAIAEGKNNIYILDNFGCKVNVYTEFGKFVDSYTIPKEFTYFNLAVDSKGKVLLLTDKGIYGLLKDQKILQVALLPESIHTPYNLSVSDAGNIGISGLGNDGYITGVFDVKQKFLMLKGYNTFVTQKGLLGVQTNEESEGYLSILRDKKTIKRIKVDSNRIAIGFTDKLNSYFVEAPSKGKVKIYRIESTGKTTFKEVEFDPQLFYDEVIYQKLFYVTSNDEVIMLNLTGDRKKLKVSIINF